MTWLTWRQYRLQGAIALALLAAFAAYEIPAAFQLMAAWHVSLTGCPGQPGGPQACPGLRLQVLGNDLRILSVLVPGILGALLGAPLVAHEMESGTTGFAWTQGITRGRWLLTKAGWLLLAAAVIAGAVSALVTFWSGPANAAQGAQFQGNYYDTQGIVPVGYAVFATAFGIAAGAVLRRTLPAIGLTVAVFIALRVLFTNEIRAHLMPAVTAVVAMTGKWAPPGISWVLGTSVVSKSGQVLTGGFDLNGTAITAGCARLLPDAAGKAAPSSDPFTAVLNCMQRAGYHQVISYQPGWRYWPFQGIEAGIYLLLAAALVAVAWSAVRRRDA